MSIHVITDSETPPVKSRIVEGVWNALCTVDLGAWIRIVEMCRKHKLGAEKYVLGENLGYKAFYAFFPIFHIDTTKGTPTKLFIGKGDMV
jgi:hypothetical protein